MTLIPYLILFGIVLVLLIAGKPKVGIVFLMFFLYFLDWFLRNFLLLEIETFWVVDFMLIALFISGFFNNGTIKHERSPIDIYAAFLFGIILVSAMVNLGDLLGLSLGLRRGLRTFLIFYVIRRLNFDEQFTKGIIRTFILIGFLQIPVTLWEHFFWQNSLARIFRSLSGPDGNTGTFGGSSTQALCLYQIFIIFLTIGLALYVEGKISVRKILAVSSLCIIFPLAVSGGSYYILALTFIIMMGLTSTQRKVQPLILSTSGLAILYFVFYDLFFTIHSASGTEYLSYIFDINFLYESLTKLEFGSSADQGRIAVLIYTFNLLSDSLVQLFLGYGPGNFLLSRNIGYAGVQYDFNVPSVGYTGITSVLGEFGLFGLFIMFIMLFRLFLWNWKFFKKCEIPFWKGVSYAYFAFILVFGLGFFYVNPFTSDALAFPFWFVGSSLMSIAEKYQLGLVINRYRFNILRK